MGRGRSWGRLPDFDRIVVPLSLLPLTGLLGIGEPRGIETQRRDGESAGEQQMEQQACGGGGQQPSAVGDLPVIGLMACHGSLRASRGGVAGATDDAGAGRGGGPPRK